MKSRIITLAAAAIIAASCSTGKPADLQKEAEELDSKIEAIYGNTNLTEEQMEEQAATLYNEAYAKHHDDSLGISLFKALLTNYWSSEKSFDEFAKASELVKTNDLINTKIESLKHTEDVLPGKAYIEISGPDAMTGDSLCIGDILKEGKPVLVDFWASWCGPCRKEIKEHLISLNETGKVNIIGIAVWENSAEDTKKAIEDYGISWPVIYTGGRKDSPSIKYGVLGIPTLFLISPEGTIMGSGHSIEEIDFFNE